LPERGYPVRGSQAYIVSRTCRSPRILYVSETPPRNSSFGGEVRCLNVARALREMGGTVEAVVLDDKDRGASQVTEPDCEFPVAYTLDVEPRRNQGLVGKLKWTFDPRADYPNGCRVEHDGLSRVLRTLKDFDLIWFFRLRSPDVFPNAAWRKSVVDIDDLPSTYERAALRVGPGLGERLSARRRLYSWERREKLLGDRFTVLTVCSEEDRQYLEQIGVKVPVHVVPNGFEKPHAEPIPSPAAPPRIGFIGLFDFFPNRDGIQWFVNNCWPSIKRQVPDARLRLVGRDRDEFLKAFGPDVDRLGWLANPSDEINSWSAMVVPIRVGAGTRIKIAQGFSQKCPIVSTTLGAHGYGVVDGREMYLADSAEAFSNACINAIREPEKAAQMAERGWRQFLEKWTWDAIRNQVWAAAEDCLRRTQTGASVDSNTCLQIRTNSLKQK
jgi:glycosyltransferase involved in cell wall biosynthesis